MKNKDLFISIIILVVIILVSFMAGYLFMKESNPVPIIIEKCSE